MPKHLVHIHSVQTTDGQPKLPESSMLNYGELAINYAKGYETISLKNNSDEIVQFKSDEYYQEQLDSKQNTLTPGIGIEITDGNIINVTLDTTVFKVVESKLPMQPEAGDENKIHLRPTTINARATEPWAETAYNLYDEYLWVDNKWELIGTYQSDVDLSSYLTKEEAEETYIKVEDVIGNYITGISFTSAATEDTAAIGINYRQKSIPVGHPVPDKGDVTITIALPSATPSQAGVLSAADKQKLDSLSVPEAIDVSTLFASTASVTSDISSKIAELGNSGTTEFPVLYAGSSIGNIKPTWIRTTSGVTNMMCLADNKIYYFEISGTTVQRAELAIS